MARHRLEVPLRVHPQIGADREPEVPAAAARPFICALCAAVNVRHTSGGAWAVARALLRGALLVACLTTTNAGARDAWQASLQANKRDRPPPRSPIWDKSFRCVVNGKNASTNAYAVVLGPISEERKYSK